MRTIGEEYLLLGDILLLEDHLKFLEEAFGVEVALDKGDVPL